MSFFFTLDVLQRFNRREPGARGWVYQKHYAFVYSLVGKATGHSPNTEDLVENIFLKLLEYPKQFKSMDKIKYFLYTTAKNTCIDYLRQRQSRQEKLHEISRYMDLTEENSLEQAEAKAALQQLIYSSIEALPRQCRNVFILYFSKELNNSQIAARLNISEKTVSNQKTIAFRMLKMKIGKINGASVTLFMSCYQFAIHLHQVFRIIRSAWG